MKTFFSIILSISLLSVFSQSNEKYEVKIDLLSIENDQIPVVIYLPNSSGLFTEYHIPKIVPGTYSISDFGRFITDFKAKDIDGNELEVTRIDTNRWKITNEGKLHEISYKINDSRDACDGYNELSENIVFEPGGTDFQANELFIINTFGVIGYLQDLKFKPYEVTINHSEEMYGSSALKKTMKNASQDLFTAEDYNFLADGPIMYCVPDTVTKQIANAEVLVSVYSPNKQLSASEVMENLDDLMDAQAKYLGGKLPVDRYAFLINLFDDNTFSQAYGALEHSYSSLYNFPEGAASQVSQVLRDMASHEFFHIVTPLNIHSKEIGEFDYINPQMSRHLWLYEGITEYSSMHVQVKYDLYSPEIFLKEISNKMAEADSYASDVSFTEMSENILLPEYEDLYGDVYEKGALIGMCLDLYLLKYSNGEKDLPWLMRELSNKYGKNQSFDDEELFKVITNMTYPEVGQFLTTYVEGNDPLPFEEVLGWVGIDYNEPVEKKEFFLGIAFTTNSENQFLVANLMSEFPFAYDLGLQPGDVVTNINGTKVSFENSREAIQKLKSETKDGEKVYFVVNRMIKGKLKKKKLKAKLWKVDVMTEYEVLFQQNPTENQLALRQKWISIN